MLVRQLVCFMLYFQPGIALIYIKGIKFHGWANLQNLDISRKSLSIISRIRVIVGKVKQLKSRIIDVLFITLASQASSSINISLCYKDILQYI